MERAPLPPHERSWRHPSELGSASTVAGPGGDGDRRTGGLLATGTLAVIVVAALVAAITPGQSPSPVALSSTTLPAPAQPIRAAVSTVTTSESQASIVALANSVRRTRLDDFRAIPSAIAWVPGGLVNNDEVLADLATGQITASTAILPDLTDEVTVIADDYVYAVQWRDVAQLTTLDDAVVVSDDGVIVALIADGRLTFASDSYVAEPDAPAPSIRTERAHVGAQVSVDE